MPFFLNQGKSSLFFVKPKPAGNERLKVIIIKDYRLAKHLIHC